MVVKTKDIPIYFGYLRVIICKDFKKAATKLNVNTETFKVENYASFVYTDRTKKNIARYSIFIRKNINPSIIAHEAVHLVNALFIDSDIQLDRHNDEPQAYLTGWFVSEINKALKK